ELHRSFTGASSELHQKGGNCLLQIEEEDGIVAVWSPKSLCHNLAQLTFQLVQFGPGVTTVR
ncbi:hypothetical protein LINPERPRIM_LOCUS13054, partial [Linum perenne]